jgi:hypothetical protein
MLVAHTVFAHVAKGHHGAVLVGNFVIVFLIADKSAHIPNRLQLLDNPRLNALNQIYWETIQPPRSSRWRQVQNTHGVASIDRFRNASPYLAGSCSRFLRGCVFAEPIADALFLCLPDVPNLITDNNGINAR